MVLADRTIVSLEFSFGLEHAVSVDNSPGTTCVTLAIMAWLIHSL